MRNSNIILFYKSDTFKVLIILWNNLRLKDPYAGYILPPNVAECTISQIELFTHAEVPRSKTKRP
jgi:hypothetical protein